MDLFVDDAWCGRIQMDGAEAHLEALTETRWITLRGPPPSYTF